MTYVSLESITVCDLYASLLKVDALFVKIFINFFLSQKESVCRAGKFDCVLNCIFSYCKLFKKIYLFIDCEKLHFKIHR